MGTLEQKCLIWGTEADVGDISRELCVDSPRAGGKYKTHFNFFGYPPKHLKNFKKKSTFDEKVKLTDWLVEQREAGVEVPHIDSGVLEHIKTRGEKGDEERIDSIMLYLVEEYTVGDQIFFEFPAMMLMAISGSSGDSEALAYLDECVSRGYLDKPESGLYKITLESKKCAEEIRKGRNQKSDQKADEKNLQCFVAMWFDKSMDDVYEKAIKPAIIDAGYKPYRVDEDHHNGKIDDLIIAEIRKSRFILADFTSKPKEPRGGVYFEAGFAYGLEIPVIWTCQQKLIKHIHFDTRQFRHIGWQKNRLRSFYNRLYDSIEANIGRGEDAKDKGTSFSQ